ncbi:glutathione-disulfide reductase [Paracoccus aminophilus]|uniref:Glutathione reductase (NADPH) n=1 Tax=Paracoccus aminophilus JCM 7686 TaxID=1367847 RepID=S5XMH2_PARAH|nr:glutathione-disulfide reductase [Paracoccus aminophilus]AGT08489.1 glutathione reductase (NADPH) [Paracoccus aminophilus JCM 7686]
MTFDYDLFVIGGGSGGARASRISAGEYGARVAVAEESRMGGTCVIRGCVPKKLMIYGSQMPKEIEEARGYGWVDASVGPFDWPMFRDKLNRELNRLEAAYTNGMVNAGVDTYKSRARIVDPHTVELSDGTRYTTKHILIAVGGRPALPGIEGEEHGLISDDLFQLERLPGKVLLVGGGYIACEFATILNGFGCKTILAYRGDALLRGFDEEMRDHVSSQVVNSGIELRVQVTPKRLEKVGERVLVTFDDDQQEEFDDVIFATGRKPYTWDLGLENVGVKLGPNGQILVDEWSQTSVPSIYAVGDVTDLVNLTPVAIRAGHNFADTVFGGKPKPCDFSQVPSAVYTRPHELATIGLTEEQAAARGQVDIYSGGFRPMRSLFAGSEARSVMKLIVDVETDLVLGCHIFGPDAGEMLQMVAVAMGMGATKADFDRAVAIHPTVAEELVTMRKPVRRVGEAKPATLRHSAVS